MAAFTSKANGDWSTAGQVVWNETGVPGDGDTVTIAHAVTISADTTVGSSPNTGGTAAITFGSGGSLVHTAGVATVKGDINQDAASTWTMAAGTSVAFYPPSGQQYKWDFGTSGSPATLSCNGSSGSRCTVKTDATAISGGGVRTYMKREYTHNMGLMTATFTDFTDMGDTSNAGVLSCPTTTAGWPNTTITDCTFTRCNYQFLAPVEAWDGNLTFQRNRFTDSTSMGAFLGVTCCAAFNFSDVAISGTRLIDLCSFDIGLLFPEANSCKVTNCVVIGSCTCLAGSWPDATYFHDNFLSKDAGPYFGMYGNSKNCYMFHSAADNPHYVSVSSLLTAAEITGFVFESADTSGNGDIIFPQSVTTGTPTLAVKNCITLPNAASPARSSGKLVSNVQGASGTVAVIAEHNTYYCGPANYDGNSAVVALGEAAAYIHQIAYCRANLVWYSTTGTGGLAAADSSGGSAVTDAVDLAGYNGFWNPTTGTCTLDSVPTSTPGYNGLKCSTPSFPSAQLGDGDVSGDPDFVDSTRNLKTWGASQGADGTNAGAIALLVANPALIGQAGTGLIPWVKAGFRPQSLTYKGASYATDALTTDASGNEWAGVLPDIGAMAVLESVPATTGAAMMMGA